jgi:hypothetical protein
MGHFSSEQWFEFASRRVSSAQKSLMDEHLEEGCDACRHLLVMWTEVIEISRRELNYQPPSAAVQSAIASFKPEERWKWFPQIAQAARLIFDSIWEPAPVAIRGSRASSRQFLQEAKPFIVDLQVEHEPERRWMRLTGQVLNSVEPAKNVDDVEIFLLDGEHLAAKTTATPSGEFVLEFEFKGEEGIQLYVDIRGQKVIEIKLPNSLGEDRGAAAGAE